jgi:hypothetical protein
LETGSDLAMGKVKWKEREKEKEREDLGMAGPAQVKDPAEG